VLTEQAFVLRWFGEGGDDRLLLVNLGKQRRFRSIVDPLFAPPSSGDWQERWSSEDVRYGGDGAVPSTWNRASTLRPNAR